MENQQINSPLELTCFEALQGVKVCYLTISSFLDVCLVPDDYRLFHTKRNKLFNPEDFQVNFLGLEELSTVNKYKSLKKQIEWMAGRFLVKTMVKDTLDNKTAMTEITVGHAPGGAPFIVGYPHIRISISHSGNHAGVALTTRRDMDMGLDIEVIGKKPDEWFMKTAFTPKEISAMEPTPVAIFSHWTVKEAFLKLIKQGFNESLHNVEVIGDTIFFNGVKAEVSNLSTTIGKGYALSLVWGQSR